MGQVNDDLALDQLIMPGSHDTGMSELHHCNPPVGAGRYTQTQSESIGQQLASGARYFDIRVDYDHNKLVTYHRSGPFGCNGQDLQAILDQTRAFLSAHQTETAILKFSHVRNYRDHNPTVTKQKINDLLNSYSDLLYTNSTPDTNLAKVKLADARGKAILVFDYSQHIDPATGRFRYKDGDSIQSSANLTVFDQYSNTPDYETMKTDQLAKWKAHAGLGQGYFFLLSWTLTANAKAILEGKSIKSLAKIANSHLPGVLHDQIATAGAKKPNIVYIDFLSSAICQDVIAYNFS